MGRVRTKTVKKSAKVIIERYYPRLTLDFEANKRICDEIAIIASKRLRNKVSLVCLGSTRRRNTTRATYERNKTSARIPKSLRAGRRVQPTAIRMHIY